MWNRFYADNESFAAIFNATKMYYQLWHLLHHRRGTRFILFAITNVVNFIIIDVIYLITCHLNSWNAFFVALKRFPFDWNGPLGYLIAVVLEYFIFSYEYLVIACTLSLRIAAFCFTISVIQEIHGTLNSINRETNANVNESNELKLLLCEFIRLHVSVKQLSFPFYLLFIRQLTFYIQSPFRILIAKNCCFQSGKGLFRHFPTHIYVCFYVEPPSNFCCIASYQIGNSCVLS